jgi:hypothetical protein
MAYLFIRKNLERSLENIVDRLLAHICLSLQITTVGHYHKSFVHD